MPFPFSEIHQETWAPNTVSYTCGRRKRSLNREPQLTQHQRAVRKPCSWLLQLGDTHGKGEGWSGRGATVPCRGVGMESVGGQSELCLRFPGNRTSSSRKKRKQEGCEVWVGLSGWNGIGHVVVLVRRKSIQIVFWNLSFGSSSQNDLHHLQRCRNLKFKYTVCV